MWFVQRAEQRFMCDQNVCVVGNHLPISSDRRAARDIECPIIEFGLNWRSPDFQSFRSACERSKILKRSAISLELLGSALYQPSRTSYGKSATPLLPHSMASAVRHIAPNRCQPLRAMSFSYNNLTTHNPKVGGSNPLGQTPRR
jgi:hypothetical protein